MFFRLSWYFQTIRQSLSISIVEPYIVTLPVWWNFCSHTSPEFDRNLLDDGETALPRRLKRHPASNTDRQMLQYGAGGSGDDGFPGVLPLRCGGFWDVRCASIAFSRFSERTMRHRSFSFFRFHNISYIIISAWSTMPGFASANSSIASPDENSFREPSFRMAKKRWSALSGWKPRGDLFLVDFLLFCNSLGWRGMEQPECFPAHQHQSI